MATGVVLANCPGLSPRPRLLEHTTALADQLAECHKVIRLGYDASAPQTLQRSEPLEVTAPRAELHERDAVGAVAHQGTRPFLEAPTDLVQCCWRRRAGRCRCGRRGLAPAADTEGADREA